MLSLRILSVFEVSSGSVQICTLHGFERNAGGRNNKKREGKWSFEREKYLYYSTNLDNNFHYMVELVVRKV